MTKRSGQATNEIGQTVTAWVFCELAGCPCGGKHPVEAIRVTATHMLHASQADYQGASGGFTVTHRETGCAVVEGLERAVADEFLTLIDAIRPPWDLATVEDFENKELWRSGQAFVEEMLDLAQAARVKS